ncbi:MAG TPA: BamA/TamA family outer membrane protein [Oculatellaceae cyanobacterium]
MILKQTKLNKLVAGAALAVLLAQSVGVSAYAADTIASAQFSVPFGGNAKHSDDASKKQNEGAPSAPLNAEVSESESEGGGNAKASAASSKDSAGNKDDKSDSAQQSQQKEINPSDLTVDDVKIEGNRLVETDDIMKVVKTKPGDKYDRDQVVQDLKAINGLGYFDDRSLRVDPQLTNNGVLLKIRVQENAPVSQFSFQGNKVLSTEEIHKIFADQLEKPQNLNQLTAAIDKVEAAYHDKGFVLARVTDVKDDPDGSIALTINEGVIDDIQVTGNRKTKDFIVKHQIKIKPGEVYNEKNLTNDLRKLYANGYFQDIRRSLAPSAKDKDKYVLKVEVDEKRTGSVSAGGGIDSVYGPFGTLGFSDGNFRGRGQVLSFQGQTGAGMFGNVTNSLNNSGSNFVSNQRTWQMQADWIEPNLKGTDTSMGVSLFGRNMNSFLIDQSQQQTIGASVNFSKPLSKILSANLGFSAEDTILKNVADYISTGELVNQMATRAIQQGYVSSANPLAAQNFANNVRNNMMKGGLYVSVNPSLVVDTRDDKMSPTRGMLARVTASPSVGTGGAFIKAGFSVSKYIPVTKETVFATNFQAGTSMGNVPGFAQYSLGGFNGIRGYRQFSDLGLGSNMLMARAELRHSLPIPKTDNKLVNSLHKRIKLALFADAGQVSGSNTYNNLLARNNSAGSVGLSLRMNLPMVGNIRVDYGYPLLSTLLGSRTPRLTFGFGDKF